MHSLVASCMCPDQRLNPQPWCIEMMLEPTELPDQGQYVALKKIIYHSVNATKKIQVNKYVSLNSKIDFTISSPLTKS